jgi:hypothetical protein
LIDANTNFSITSENKNGGLTIEAYSRPSFDSFINIMDFSTGELTFHSHRENQDTSRRSGLNATEVISYQYLTYYQVLNIHAYLHEVVGALQQILKAFLVLNIGKRYYQRQYAIS